MHSGEQKYPEELDWRLKNSEECGSGREKSETNPSNHPLPFHRQEDQQNKPDQFKASRLFFSFILSPQIPSSFLPFFLFIFLLPSIPYLFYSFFMPSPVYFFVLIFVKIPYLASGLSFFPLPSFLSFSIPFFPPSGLFFSPPPTLFIFLPEVSQ